jgi:hypothetical protein
VIKKPRKNEEAKARYRAVENTTTMGFNARKTNKQENKQIKKLLIMLLLTLLVTSHM